MHGMANQSAWRFPSVIGNKLQQLAERDKISKRFVEEVMIPVKYNEVKAIVLMPD